MTDLDAAWARDIVRLLRALPPDAVTVLTLRYFSGLSEHEICARTGWKAQRVRTAGAVGMRDLGRALQAEYREDGDDAVTAAVGTPGARVSPGVECEPGGFAAGVA